MRLALLVSVLIGMAWAVLVNLLMNEGFPLLRPVDILIWIIPGLGAGLFTGYTVIWSTNRSWGYVRSGLLAYYVGIIAYWTFVFCALRINAGLWTSLNLRDHFIMLPMMLLYGTYPYGILLIPLAIISAALTYKIYIAQLQSKI